MFIVVEVQRNGENISSVIFTSADRNQAESKYHEMLMYAAISTVEIHTVVMFSDLGSFIKSETFDHRTGDIL